MSKHDDPDLPARWWVWMRLAAILVTIWMGIGFFVMLHSFAATTKMSSIRLEQAAQLAGVPLTADETTYFGPVERIGLPVGVDRADQIVAIGALASFESDRATDSVSGMIATATAGVGSLVVFLSGVRAWNLSLGARRKPASVEVPRTRQT